ncbi:MAG TPA: thioesterase family protein, partial [Dongiaceae bacterium]|nr:thioesterase family protein [Dongiaceae bacterium]
TNQHWFAELIQGGQTAVTATAVLATRSATWESTELRAPDVPAANTLKPWPSTTGPAWIKRYDLRFVQGLLTLSGTPAQDSASVIWVRDEPPRPLDFLTLMAISDVFFPRTFIRQQKLGVAGTVSITTHFHADAETLARQGDRSLLAAARGQRFHRNYFDQIAELWSDGGELLATSSQMVYFKD